MCVGWRLVAPCAWRTQTGGWHITAFTVSDWLVTLFVCGTWGRRSPHAFCSELTERGLARRGQCRGSGWCLFVVQTWPGDATMRVRVTNAPRQAADALLPNSSSQRAASPVHFIQGRRQVDFLGGHGLFLPRPMNPTQFQGCLCILPAILLAGIIPANVGKGSPALGDASI